MHPTGPCGVALDALPHASAQSYASPAGFRLPLGIDRAGRVTILFLALESSPDIARTVLRRHVPLLRALRLWTWRVVLPRAFEGVYDAFQTMVDDALKKPRDALYGRAPEGGVRTASCRPRGPDDVADRRRLAGFRERSFHA